jgi:hypothetical protein
MTQATQTTQEQFVESLKTNGSCVFRNDTTDLHFTVNFEIRRGSRGKMFTLRLRIPTDKSFMQDLYLGALSNDYEKALAKAVDIVLNSNWNVAGNRVTLDVKATKVGKIEQGNNENDAFPFGKYKGCKFSDIADNDYKAWLYNVLSNKGNGYIKVTRCLRENMIANGFQERNGSLVSPEQLQREQEQQAAKQSKEAFWDDLRQNSRYLQADIGAKTSFFKAYLLTETSFETAFGRCFVQVFVDDEKRVFVYKGNEAVIEAGKGEAFYIRGKVKDFTNYNGICQTRLSNVVVLATNGDGFFGDKAAKRAKADGYETIAEACDNPDFVEEVIQHAHKFGKLPKKDMPFARRVIKEVLGQKEL